MVNSIEINVAAEAFQNFTATFTAYLEYKKNLETEITRRSAISNWKDVEITKLQNQKAILEAYLTEIFRERSQIIKNLFSMIEQGIENDNNYLIDKGVTGIISIAKESPLAQAKDIMLAMYDKNVKCIEI